MSRFQEALQRNQPKVVENWIARGQRAGYARLAPSSAALWAQGVSGMTKALIAASGGEASEPEVTSFAVHEAQRHRARGLSLGLFIALFKELRYAFREVLSSDLSEEDGAFAASVIERTFDQCELAVCTDWDSADADLRLAEFQREVQVQTEEKTRYLTILDGLPLAVMFADREGRVHLMNRVAAELFVPELGGVAGVGAWARAAEVLGDLAEELRKFDASGRMEASFEREVRTAAGPRFFQVSLRRTVDVSERFLGTVLILNDISARRAAEESLERAHKDLDRLVHERTLELAKTTELIETVIRYAPLAMVLLTPEGVVRMWNPGAERLFGFTEAEAVGRLAPFVRPEDAEDFRIHNLMVANSGIPHKFDVTRHRKDGTPVEIEAYVAPINGPDGRAESVIGIVVDVTAQRQADRALRESELRYRTLVEMSPDAIAVHQDGKVVFANPAAARLLGAASPEELLGRPIMDFVHPRDRDFVARRVRQMLAGQSVPKADETFVRLDGSSLMVETSAAPITFQGRPAVQVLVHDVTARREAEDTIRKQAEALKAQTEMLRALSDLDREMAQHLYPETMLQAVLRMMPNGPSLVSISLLDEEFGHVAVAMTRDESLAIVEEECVSLEQGLLTEVVEKGAPLFVEDLAREVRVRVCPPFDAIPVRSLLCIPLTIRGRTIGLFYVLAGVAEALRGESREFYQTLAGRLAIGIENTRLFAETKYRAEVVERILSAHMDANVRPAFMILDALSRSCGGGHACWFRFEQETGRLVLEEAIGMPPGVDHSDLAFVVGEEGGPVGRVAATRKPLYIPDIQPGDCSTERCDPKARSAYLVPVKFADRLFGVAAVLKHRPYAFHKGHRTLADLFAQYIGTMMERARLLSEVREAEARFRSIFENAVEGIYQRDASGRITAANPALARILGFDSVERLVGADAALLLHGTREADETFMAEIRQHGVVRGFESSVRRGDGKALWLSENARAVFSAEGQVIRVEGMVEDVTRRRELEAQLRHAQRMEAVGRLAGGVAHDFNNLLTAIMGYTALILDHVPPENPLRHEVEEVWNAGKRAAALTGQLLTFSRRQVLQPTVVDIASVVLGIDPLLRRLIGEDITLVVECEARDGFVVGDRGQLEQVIVNLVVNARDAMERGGTLTVRTANLSLKEPLEGRYGGTVPPGDFVELSVRDTGCGMDREVLAHVFEPFFTTKGPGKGTGLGLAVVYGIVTQSNGHILIESEVGSGTLVRIFLPRAEKGVQLAEANGKEERPRGGGETILVVEDDEAVRALTVDVLSRYGYRVLSARDGNEAMEIASKQHVDLLLTDIVMPGFNGHQLADRILERYGDVRVVFTSGYSDNDAVFLGMMKDGATFLQKPYEPADLARVVREQLDRKTR